MEAKDLRIGNIVNKGSYYGNEPVTPYEIYQFSLDTNSKAEYYKEWKPTPLTEEWLIKLEFIKDIDRDEDQYYGNYGVHLYWYEFASNTYNGWYMRRDVGDELKIKYVHQLQNLYFALTGEELTIKESLNHSKD